jgi:uncharacterized protein (TIGR02246 family)
MPDPDAIVAAVEAAYSSAYSDADPKRLTALFAEDATVQTEWGPVLSGRDEATRGLIALFAASATPDSLENQPVLSRQVSPHVIVSHGTASRKPVDRPVEQFLYTRVYVERDGQWVIAAIHMARPSEHPRPDGIGGTA